ncbi:MAG: SDR family oxidoreductase, partial [Oxalobacteraceae bacterium]
NLMIHLAERGEQAIAITSRTPETELRAALQSANFVFHLAGVNRPTDDTAFVTGNVDLTQTICDILADHRRTAGGGGTPVVYTSSIQAERDNPYGRSKRAAEQILTNYATAASAPVRLFRLPNVFGKWARANYNSVVATFCHNIAKGLDIRINDPSAPLELVYVDDVCAAFLELLEALQEPGAAFATAEPVYTTTVGAVADAIYGFARSRQTLLTERVGTGLTRALYSTYLSNLEPASFAYDVPRHGDARGVFVEMLKTPDCGQFSYFTAGPGITRGEHYHHSKNEKFLVLTGQARFGFRHIVTNKRYEIIISGGEGRIVETIPGWTHDITNIGDQEMVVMLWANEIFERDRPDTVACKV